MNKTVLITGASSGIGRTTARLFISKGWNVVVTLRRPDLEREFETSDTVLVTKLDVTDPAGIQAALEQAVGRFSKIDVVVNNAGYGLLGAFEAAEESQIRQQFETNVFGLLNVTQACLPLFRAQKGGTFVNVASMIGKLTLPFFSLYAATKWSVEGFSEALAYEVAPFNIRVKVVEPGTIKSDFYTRSLQVTRKEGLRDYDEHFARVISNIRKRGERGAPTSRVADTIYRAATDTSGRFRYVPDTTAKFLLTLNYLLPLDVFRRIIKQTVR